MYIFVTPTMFRSIDFMIITLSDFKNRLDCLGKPSFVRKKDFLGNNFVNRGLTDFIPLFHFSKCLFSDILIIQTNQKTQQ